MYEKPIISGLLRDLIKVPSVQLPFRYWFVVVFACLLNEICILACLSAGTAAPYLHRYVEV